MSRIFVRYFTLFSCAMVPTVGLADDCKTRLSVLLAKPPYAQIPYEAKAVGMIGGMETITLQHFASDTHSLITTLEPKGMPDTLFYQGGTYHPDGDGGWALLYSTDLDSYVAGLAASRLAQSQNVLDAQCETVTIEGANFDKISGTIDVIPPNQSQWQVSFTLDPSSDLPKIFSFSYSLNGMEAMSQFEYTAKPDLVLPTP